MNQLLLWDIDGTLILGGNLGAKTLANYFHTTYGWSDVGAAINPHGMTDPRIVDAIFEHFHHTPTAEEHQDVLDQYVQALESAMENPNNGSYCLPGVPSILQPPAGSIQWHHGLLTGNVRKAACIKLRHHNLWGRFSFGAFGEDGVQRSDLIPVAWHRAKSGTGIDFDPKNTWIIGDTPKDAAAAAVYGTRLILVGTSLRYSMEDLQACNPDLLFEDFSDNESFWEQLGAACTTSN